MPLSKKMTATLVGSSIIRKMFEEGIQMKACYGAENVFDFSLGNPDLPPPAAYKEALTRLVAEDRPGSHSYMVSPGWPAAREKVAAFLNRQQGAALKVPFTADHVVLTVGAAGGINVILKAILDPGDEVITPRPYFPEYNFYVDNHGGKLVTSEPGPDFSLNLEDLEAKITPATRAIIINSPHNPTGVIYSAEELAALGRLLTEASKKIGRPIILISDEPYRKLAYDGCVVPSVFPAYPYTLTITSFSKDLSLPGERIGYVTINPEMPEGATVMGGLATAQRILGFVSATSLMQLVIAEILDASVDIALYEKRRNMFVKGLQEIGYKLTVPKGAFYLFPKTPIEDDAAFVALLKEEKILTVPGRTFAMPGYFRICYCVPEDCITKSLPGFARTLEKARK